MYLNKTLDGVFPFMLQCTLLCKLGVALEGLSQHLLSDSRILFFLADESTISRGLMKYYQQRADSHPEQS